MVCSRGLSQYFLKFADPRFYLSPNQARKSIFLPKIKTLCRTLFFFLRNHVLRQIARLNIKYHFLTAHLQVQDISYQS